MVGHVQGRQRLCDGGVVYVGGRGGVCDGGGGGAVVWVARVWVGLTTTMIG